MFRGTCTTNHVERLHREVKALLTKEVAATHFARHKVRICAAISWRLNHRGTDLFAEFGAACRAQREHAAQVMRTRRRGDGVLYVPPWRFAHPKSRAFWLGGASEGRRAQGQ